MKIKDKQDINSDTIFPEDTLSQSSNINRDMETKPHKSLKFKNELTRESELADLDLMLSELPKTKFNRQKRKEIEAHRRELVKAQQAEEREKIKLSKAARKEEERRIKWAKKSVDAETATKLAEERQKEALAKDRKRRAKRRKFDRLLDIVGKLIFGIILIIGVLCISNQTVRDRIAITFDNLFELVESWTNNDGQPSNKTVNDLLKPLGEELNEVNTTKEGFTIEE